MDQETSGAASALDQALRSGRFVITAEISPPVSTDPADLLARALPLKGLATAVNVTDGAGAKAHLSSLVAARLLLDHGIEPILQMTCRDRNRLALQSDLLGALALGIRNILILRGDDPSAGDQPDAKPVFDLESRTLLETAERMRRDHRLPTGTEIKGPVALLLGAADTPIDPPPGWTPQSLLAKQAAGVDFIQTQFCLDIAVVRRYAARLAELDIVPKLKILIGVSPIPSARSARWMREKLFGTIIPDAVIERLDKAADPRTEGRAICVELLQQLAEIPGIAGAHIMAPQNPAAIAGVIADAAIAG
ncbi:MAG: methylenetetrahydrofolate reductase [Proteobacteria bacterium]|nr:methylenetetrahydrofolate reductase [Pseudomonadota bacterium]